MEKINLEDVNKATMTRLEFKEFFSSTVMAKLMEQMFNNKETNLVFLDDTSSTRHPVSLYLLNSISASIVNRNKYYRFFFKKNIYNFYATSVKPHYYMLFLKLSNGKLIGVEVPVGDKRDKKNLMVILCSALTELYIRYTIYKDETLVISSL